PFKEDKHLGKGTSGTVSKVINVLSSKSFARKLFSLGTESSKAHQSEMEKVVAEIQHLQRLAGACHIVQLHGSYLRGTKVAILLQPVAEKDLEGYLLDFAPASTQSKKAKKKVLYRLFGCLCITLQKIHGGKLRHKDIKPANILIHGTNVLFTDFGSAIKFGDGGRGTTVSEDPKGHSPMYAAPEVWKKEARDVISDVFSLGCVFLEVITVL
ncbi:kinase-like protein, partial [Lindgomyces ingoldianus]